MSLRLYMDVHVRRSVTTALRFRGVDVLTAQEDGTARWDDGPLLDRATDTERTDRREKFLSYTQIETLEEYILVAQDKMEVTLFRRATNWQAELLHLPEQSLHLASIEFGLTLRALYEGVKV